MKDEAKINSVENKLDGYLNWPEEPRDIGDCYLLVGYQFISPEDATLAFAVHLEEEFQSLETKVGERKWSWALQADDGDIYVWNDIIPADEILLIRRVRDGLEEHIPDKYRESALRYRR